MSPLGLLLATSALAGGLGGGAPDRGAEARGLRPAAPGEALAGRTVTIDPGHNGANGSHPSEINQPVAIGNGETKACDTAGTETASGLSEAAYAFSVAKRLRRRLEALGARVVMTRESNDGVGPCIDRRARIGNRARSDAAVSIHADGGPTSGRGFHVIYPSRIKGLTDDIYRPSRRLARRLRGAYAKLTGLPEATYIGSDGLDERSDLGGLRLSDVPKVFVETANMRNPADARRLERGRFRGRIAAGIAAGLKRFLR